MVLDIISPFLEETLPPLNELSLVVDTIMSICRELLVYIEPFIGTHEDAVARLPYIRSLYRRGMLLHQDLDTIPRSQIYLYTQGLRKTIKAKVVNLRSIGTTIIYSIPRTCDTPPILTPSALYAYYISDRRSRDLIKQGFVATHINIASILKTVPLDLAILSFTKTVSGDGPIYGYIDYLQSHFLLGKVPYLDIAAALCLGFTINDIYFAEILLEERMKMNKSEILRFAIHSVASITSCRKLKRHSLYSHYKHVHTVSKEVQHT